MFRLKCIIGSRDITCYFWGHRSNKKLINLVALLSKNWPLSMDTNGLYRIFPKTDSFQR